MLSLKIATFAILVVSLLAATKTVSISCQGCSNQMNCTANYKCLSFSSTGVTAFESCYTGTSCGSFTTTINVTVSNCTYDYKSAACSSKVCAYYPGLIIPTSPATCTPTTAGQQPTFTGACSTGTTAGTDCTSTSGCTSCYKVVGTKTAGSSTICLSGTNQTCAATVLKVSVVAAGTDTFFTTTTCGQKYVWDTANPNVCINELGSTPIGNSDAIAKFPAWVSEGIVALSALLLVGSFML